MTKCTTPAEVVPAAIVEEAWQQVGASFERFCLTAGIATLAGMMEADATRLCGVRYGRDDGKDGHRWGRTKGQLGFHGGKVALERPRVRARDGGELPLPSWEVAMAEDWLGKWALNLMLINVSTRKFGRAVRLPEGDVPAQDGAGLSKSAASRRFVALSAERMKEWMASDGFVRVTGWLGSEVAGRLSRWPNSHTAVTAFRRLSFSMLCGSTCASRSAIETSRISSPSAGSTSPMKRSGVG